MGLSWSLSNLLNKTIPQKTASQGKLYHTVKKKRLVFALEGCSSYLNEHERLSLCVACLFPRHFLESHHDNPCSLCQSLASFYYQNCKKRTGLPQLLQSGGDPNSVPPYLVLLLNRPSNPRDMVGLDRVPSPSWLFLPGMGPVYLPTPQRRRWGWSSWPEPLPSASGPGWLCPFPSSFRRGDRDGASGDTQGHVSIRCLHCFPQGGQWLRGWVVY